MINLALVLLLAGNGNQALRSPDGPVANLEAARKLLMARDFAALTKLVEAKQAAAMNAPARGRLDWTLNAFELPFPAIPVVIDEWVRSTPASWAPLMARAVNRKYQAGLARGEKLASQTSAQQFRTMEELNEGVISDCRAVLSRNPGVCPCHRVLAITAKSSPAARDLMEQAFKACPLDQTLNIEYVFGLTPRWGGSYEEMRAAIAKARQRGLPPEDVKSLEGYIPIDQALTEQGDFGAALALLEAALSKTGATPQLLQESAKFRRRMKADPARTLADADAALDLSHGGLGFSVGRLSRLLLDRAWALSALRRLPDARADIELAAKINPTDRETLSWVNYLRAPAAPDAGASKGLPTASPKP